MLKISGGQKLYGKVQISGSKNSALAILAAAVLSDTPVRLRNVPIIEDVMDMRDIINSLGGSCVLNAQGEAVISSSAIDNFFAVHPKAHKIRASCYFLGAMLGKFGRACILTPGGCNIGARPVNYHIDGMIKLGAECQIADGKIFMSAPRGLYGTQINLPYPSVGATINLMLAACTAEGITEINNAATEPNVTDTEMFLKHLGADIQGIGTPNLTIRGRKDLFAGDVFEIPPDPIETGTYLIYCAICGGKVTLKNTRPADISEVIRVLRAMGARIDIHGKDLTIRVDGRLKGADIITGPHPQFPTDLQQLIMSLMAVSEGISTITETVFENRLRHAEELNAMGAQITIEANTAIIRGVKELKPATVQAHDLRGGAALVGAALYARGVTQIEGDSYIDRGYQDIAKKLGALNAAVERDTAQEALSIS